MITSMQIKFLSKIILISKTDLDYSYHHIHVNARIKSTFIAIMENLVLIYLRLMFVTKITLVYYTIVREA